MNRKCLSIHAVIWTASLGVVPGCDDGSHQTSAAAFALVDAATGGDEAAPDPDATDPQAVGAPDPDACAGVVTCQDRVECLLAPGEPYHLCAFEIAIDGNCVEATCDSDDDCASAQPGVGAFCTPYVDGSFCTYLPPAPEDCATSGDEDFDGLADCADPDCAGLECQPIEICGNGLDDDHDGTADCVDTDCPCPEICGDTIDNDHDGAHDCLDPDCGFADGCGVVELCDDGVDNDLDGTIDCADLESCGDAAACATEPVPAPTPAPIPEPTPDPVPAPTPEPTPIETDHPSPPWSVP